ncbi:3-hydroxyacyl-[acyl-carrier-protein] dehydratase, mitochondrial [Ziziphus jujuba]|uniref:3-hydroxyacyl-[acyl-carrier-protein] dehydratase, mitochondrial n=1 Tax=Ziziphus jujuba TaxID=326968 RepID=A0ABM3I9Z4_ZIZJJ|nr:3-hydroxyacyl-[acyl-carrier-protein] dehydratase, mitochondrial [Ziziphus jujuba]
MLIRNLLSINIHCLRYFSSAVPCLLKVGDILKQTRTYSNEDVLEYSKVTHDSNALHFDSEFAQNAGFQDRLVHGMLVANMFPRILSSHFPGAVYVSQSLNFRKPVYIGEKVVGEVQAINLRENKNRYLAKFKTKCYKNGELVIDGEAMAILPSLTVAQVCSTNDK